MPASDAVAPRPRSLGPKGANTDVLTARVAPGGPSVVRAFWQRVEQRNKDTAHTLDRLGLAEYFAMEAYVVVERA